MGRKRAARLMFRVKGGTCGVCVCVRYCQAKQTQTIHKWEFKYEEKKIVYLRSCTISCIGHSSSTATGQKMCSCHRRHRCQFKACKYFLHSVAVTICWLGLFIAHGDAKQSHLPFTRASYFIRNTRTHDTQSTKQILHFKWSDATEAALTTPRPPPHPFHVCAWVRISSLCGSRTHKYQIK